MKIRVLVRRTVVAAGLSVAVLGATAGVATAEPKECRALQRAFDRTMANAEANWRVWTPLEWQVAREALWTASDRLDAAGC